MNRLISYRRLYPSVTLRGKMDADEFRDYILGFIFYKYLSEKMELYANDILVEDKMGYGDIKEDTSEGLEYLEAIKEESLEKLGYFLNPSELFKQVAIRGNGSGKSESNFIIEDIQKILINIQNSTMGTRSEEDFDHLFEDMINYNCFESGLIDLSRDHN